MASGCGEILCVGIVCLDIVNHLSHYPKEDEDIRASHQTRQSGGNASNTAKVLSLLGRKCELLSTIGVGMEADFALAELDKLGVGHGKCPVHKECRLPTSYIALNTQNGSRTIIHYRDLPELTLSEFVGADSANNYNWIHFEGRCFEEYTKMIEYIKTCTDWSPTVSVELEKTRLGLVALLPQADVIIISKEFAMFHGMANMTDTVKYFKPKVKSNAIVVCPWGEKGAAGIDKNGEVFVSAAYPPNQVVDTIGAGDTFNAALIHSLSSNKTLQDALSYSCEVAGAKCGLIGYEGLRTLNLT